MADRMTATTETIKGSHAAFVAQPRKVAQFIQKAAGESTRRMKMKGNCTISFIGRARRRPCRRSPAAFSAADARTSKQPWPLPDSMRKIPGTLSRSHRVRRRMMTWRRHTLVVMLIAIGTIGIAANPASAASTHQVPFHASFSGTAAFTSATTALLTGIGHASHLGRSTNVNHITVSGPASCPGGFTNINIETLTAANGDTLVLTGDHDQACPTGPTPSTGLAIWTVTGGTGRFAGATGRGLSDGGAYFNQGTFSFQLTGTISAPGGNCYGSCSSL